MAANYVSQLEHFVECQNRTIATLVGALEGKIAGKDQRITAEQALRAVTIDAAYSLQLENEVGTIEPGKRGNFTVLAENPLEVAPETIKDIRVLGTVHEGRVQLLK